MRAYASMYRLFRPTVISGHTRPYETHLWPQKTETYHAILPPIPIKPDIVAQSCALINMGQRLQSLSSENRDTPEQTVSTDQNLSLHS